MAAMENLPANPYNHLCWVVGEPSIGENCWIGAFVTLDGSGGLTIGRGCQIGNGAQIVTHDTVRRTLSERSYNQVDRSSTEIGEYVFIGVNAVILKGSSIGHHSVVAAGAVVKERSEFPPYSLIAGNPAVRKRSLVVATELPTREFALAKEA